eukprot:5988686-Prymnesium_polylepis.1
MVISTFGYAKSQLGSAAGHRIHKVAFSLISACSRSRRTALLRVVRVNGIEPAITVFAIVHLSMTPEQCVRAPHFGAPVVVRPRPSMLPTRHASWPAAHNTPMHKSGTV